MSNALTTTKQSDSELIAVLQSSLYPGAAIGSVQMVLNYCVAAGLDPMQKPVHIVPIWDSKAKVMRDVVMPGIGLYRTQAARSGQYAGVTEPEFGEDVTETMEGVKVTFPKWCKVTVRRLLANGAVVDFTAKELWLENYATAKRDSASPNSMWKRRPYAQLAKCAEAQALRKAFPEFGSQPTADEMEGKEFDVPAERDVTPHKPDAPTFNCAEAVEEVSNAFSLDELAEIWQRRGSEASNAKDRNGYSELRNAVEGKRRSLEAAEQPIEGEFAE